MARSLAEIMASLAPTYDPQQKLVQDQQAALPAQQAAEQSGLDTTKTNAFGDIVNSASARGVVYGGAPIKEQQSYLGSTYLPAVANLKNTYASKGTALEAALLGIHQAQSERAQSLHDTEVAQDLAAQQLAQQRAAAQSAAGLNLGALGGPVAPPVAPPDPVTLVRGAAKHQKELLTSQGLVSGNSRERVLQSLHQQFPTLPIAQLNEIVYKEVFPDGWDSSYIPQANPQQQNVMASVGYR